MGHFDEQAREFDQEHSGDDGYEIVDGMMLFSDGAARSLKSWRDIGYEYSNPPSDKTDLVSKKKRFWELRLQNLVVEFEATRMRCQNMTASDGHRFRELKAQLEKLQKAVRSARSKLAHVTTVEKGYNNGDIQKVQLAWEMFEEALELEADAKQKYEEALSENASEKILKRLKDRYDKRKQLVQNRMEQWNSFQPQQARDIVSQQLDQEARMAREVELETIEI